MRTGAAAFDLSRACNAYDAVEIDVMREADLDAVTALEATLQAFPWDRALFAQSLLAGHRAWVLRVAGEVGGFMLLTQALDEAHLLNLAVALKHQGRGIGERLLRFGLDWARAQGAARMFLEVRASNRAALRLYQRLGFAEIGRRKGYYPGTGAREDGIVFCRTLEDRQA